MKRALKWISIIIASLLVLVLALLITAVLLLDTIARKLVEKTIREKTGMNATIGEFHIGLLDSVLTIKDFKLYNTAEFGGDLFIHFPEIHVQYDREAAKLGKLHLPVVRLNMEELHVVNKGPDISNIKGFEHSKKIDQQAGFQQFNKSGQNLDFQGIDELDITLDRLVISDMNNPGASREVRFGINHEKFPVKSMDDLKAWGMAIALKSGMDIFFNAGNDPFAALVQEPTKSKSTNVALPH